MRGYVALLLVIGSVGGIGGGIGASSTASFGFIGGSKVVRENECGDSLNCSSGSRKSVGRTAHTTMSATRVLVSFSTAMIRVEEDKSYGDDGS